MYIWRLYSVFVMIIMYADYLLIFSWYIMRRWCTLSPLHDKFAWQRQAGDVFGPNTYYNIVFFVKVKKVTINRYCILVITIVFTYLLWENNVWNILFIKSIVFKARCGRKVAKSSVEIKAYARQWHRLVWVPRIAIFLSIFQPPFLKKPSFYNI